jgi:hypothetical protein
MQLLGLLGMYFNAVVVFVTNSSLLFRLALAIMYLTSYMNLYFNEFVAKVLRGNIG